MHLCLITMVFCALGSIYADGERAKTLNTIQVIDDGIFEEKKAPSSDTVEGASGKRRYKGPESNYNTQQQVEWTSKCSISNEKGSPAFKDCFRKEQVRTQDGVKIDREGAQKRMGASEGVVDSLKKSLPVDGEVPE